MIATRPVQQRLLDSCLNLLRPAAYASLATEVALQGPLPAQHNASIPPAAKDRKVESAATACSAVSSWVFRPCRPCAAPSSNPSTCKSFRRWHPSNSIRTPFLVAVHVLAPGIRRSQEGIPSVVASILVGKVKPRRRRQLKAAQHRRSQIRPLACNESNLPL